MLSNEIFSNQSRHSSIQKYKFNLVIFFFFNCHIIKNLFFIFGFPWLYMIKKKEKLRLLNRLIVAVDVGIDSPLIILNLSQIYQPSITIVLLEPQHRWDVKIFKLIFAVVCGCFRYIDTCFSNYKFINL